MTKTELYFGMASVEGDVSKEDFARFLSYYVTPRFPAGLTVIKGQGHYMMADGSIISESCRILILLHSANEKAIKDIAAIRDAYKQTFSQESVLKIDYKVSVDF